MRSTVWLTASVLVLATAALGAAYEDKKEEKFDPAKLVGKWTYVSGEKNGEKVPADQLKGQTATIEKDTMTLKGDGGEFVISYELDAKKSPVAVKMKITKAPFGEGSTGLGILELKDDELKFCYSFEGDKPPTKFEAAKDSKHHYFVLKRAK